MADTYSRMQSKRIRRFYRFPVLLLMSAVLATPLAARAVYFSLDPLDTFLRTSQDIDAGNAISVDLAALGIEPGERIRIRQIGSYQPGEEGFEDDATFILGVFSTSAVLLPGTELDRVQDAVASELDPWLTGPTFFDTLGTDISEDFAVTSSVIQVPPGATHLFLAPPDSYYSDNSDPNGDFGVKIQVGATVPAFPFWGHTLFFVLMLAAGVWMVRRKAHAAH